MTALSAPKDESTPNIALICSAESREEELAGVAGAAGVAGVAGVVVVAAGVAGVAGVVVCEPPPPPPPLEEDAQRSLLGVTVTVPTAVPTYLITDDELSQVKVVLPVSELTSITFLLGAVI